jgi:hypothetical protein
VARGRGVGGDDGSVEFGVVDYQGWLTGDARGAEEKEEAERRWSEVEKKLKDGPRGVPRNGQGQIASKTRIAQPSVVFPNISKGKP